MLKVVIYVCVVANNLLILEYLLKDDLLYSYIFNRLIILLFQKPNT